MEARVDVRKLQVLNDRITQTIDALNQVRLSVHGLGHTGGVPPQLNPMSYMNQGYGIPQAQAFGAPGIGGQGAYPGQQLPFQQIPGLGGFGLQHSPIFPGSGGPQTGLQGIPGIAGLPQSPQGFGGQGGFPGQQPPFQQGIPGGGFGLQHSPIYPGFGGPQAGLQGIPGIQQSPYQQLFHSNPELIEYKLVEARASDPYRITQTFPFVMV